MISSIEGFEVNLQLDSQLSGGKKLYYLRRLVGHCKKFKPDEVAGVTQTDNKN